jgi:hypothetical protein
MLLSIIRQMNGQILLRHPIHSHRVTGLLATTWFTVI